MHSFLSLYNENTVISKEYTGPLDFDITGVDCIHRYNRISVILGIKYLNKLELCHKWLMTGTHIYHF